MDTDALDLDGRVAVITGASRGIGAGLAEAFAARGLKLALCARSACALEDGPRVLGRTLDVTDGAAVEAFAAEVEERFGRIDLWVNNAGVLEPVGPLRDLEAGDFWRNLEVNLLGVFHGTGAFVRHLRRTEGAGVLLNISSGAAWHGYAGWSAYCAAKAGVDRLTEAVRLEEADAGLRAHAVAPGVVDTCMQETIRACSPERFPMVDKFLELKRDQAFNSIPFVATHLLAIAFDPAARPEEVVVRLPAEQETA